MDFGRRLETAERLEKLGSIKVGKDKVTAINGLVYVETSELMIHPLYGYPLDNPMTWDTFTHIYLLGK